MIRQSLVAATGLILALTGAGVLGIWFSPLEIAQAPTPHLAALSFGLTVLLSIFRIWRWSLAMFACLLWQLALWLPHSGASSLPVPTNVGRIFVLPVSNLQAVDYVRSRMPELVIVSDRSNAGHDRLKDLAALYPNSVGLEDGSGIVILARDGISLDRIPAAQADASFLLARTVIEGRALTVGAVHLARPFPLGEFGRQRAEARAILETLGSSSDPVILAGDFNAAPWMSTMGLLRGSGIFSWDIGPGAWPRWAPDLAMIPLDQALIGGGQMLAKTVRGPDLGSAHLPFEIHLGVWSLITISQP